MVTWTAFAILAMFFVEDKKNGDGKGGNYLEKRREINVDVDRRPTTG